MTVPHAARLRVDPGRDEYKAAAEDAVGAMLRIPADDAKFVRSWWPGGGCEFAAIAIAGVLEDRGLLEGWVMVDGKRPGEPNGHSWLELRDDSGAVIYAIDPTLHQFEEWDLPHVGPAPTPAAVVFIASRAECAPLAWPWIGTEGQPFRVTLRQVREILAADARGTRVMAATDT